jgi:hypothetical protein
MASALAHLARMKQLTGDEWMQSQRLAFRLAEAWSVVQPSDSLRASAVHLVNRHSLRAADALQLAAALEWCEDAPQGQVFLAADHNLREAAMLSGFDGRRL